MDSAEPVRQIRRELLLSAYCVYVKKLADARGMEYACKDGRLAFFGLCAF